MATEEANIETIVDTLSALSVLDLSKLKKALEEKWEVTAAVGAPVMMAAPVAGAEAAAEEATDFDVVLEEVPADKKIAVIKVVRELTGDGLKESKEKVESAPKTIKEGAPKAEAEEMKKKLVDAGAKVTLKGV